MAKTAANLIAAAVSSAVVFGGLWWIVDGLNKPVPRYLVVVIALVALAIPLAAMAIGRRRTAAGALTFAELADDEKGFLMVLLSRPDSYIGGEQFGDVKRMRGWDPGTWNAIEDSLWRQHDLITAVYAWDQRGQGDPNGWELNQRGKRLLAEAQRTGHLQLPASWQPSLFGHAAEPEPPPPIPGNWKRIR